ncbi:MAG: hypothetical protein MIO93_11505 [ANME-2 cluster archaeon]|nr:hypothetical protein [ANME-2 cluster archaeon]
MTNISFSISLIANLISILLALTGFYFVYKNWCIWKNARFEILKARAFLNKKFLEKNWLYIVIAGGLIMVRRIYRFFELTFEYEGHPEIEVIFDLIGCAVILVLVLMAYQWYKLMHTHSVYKES